MPSSKKRSTSSSAPDQRTLHSRLNTMCQKLRIPKPPITHSSQTTTTYHSRLDLDSCPALLKLLDSDPKFATMKTNLQRLSAKAKSGKDARKVKEKLTQELAETLQTVVYLNRDANASAKPTAAVERKRRRLQNTSSEDESGDNEESSSDAASADESTASEATTTTSDGSSSSSSRASSQAELTLRKHSAKMSKEKRRKETAKLRRKAARKKAKGKRNARMEDSTAPRKKKVKVKVEPVSDIGPDVESEEGMFVGRSVEVGIERMEVEDE